MKAIQNIGLVVFLVGLALFTGITFTGEYTLTQEAFETAIKEETRTKVGAPLQEALVGKTFGSAFSIGSAAVDIVAEHNAAAEAAQDWDNKAWQVGHKDLGFPVAKAAITSPVSQNPWLWFFFTFGLGIIGSLMYILPNVMLLGPPGIKNNGVFQHAATSRGWIGITAFIYLVSFYIALYWFPDLMVNQVLLIDQISIALSGNPASQWFLYGFMYCVVMVVMGIRMMIKYRHNRYQMVRTASVLFFQIGFAFLIPELLVKFNMPYMDLKNAWPLDYDFFFDWNISNLAQSGNVGIFMLVWGTVLTLIVVPVFVYIYGKRWYCSWVCGCGGLAETLGDPYRQLSDKRMKAWKLERWLIHGVLVFAVVMTVAVIWTFFQDNPEGYWLTTAHFVTLLGILVATGGFIFLFSKGDFRSTAAKYRYAIVGVGASVFLVTVVAWLTSTQNVFFVDSNSMRSQYGFLIGSVFSGVIGTGFYPVFGNRVWCRFGCPLAAYMGIVQRFKSRFRITTNGGQCISCGNCSTYCEQGIDVRHYAQRGQNIVRASCVGCGICAAVCPRGVLKLENGPEQDRLAENPILVDHVGSVTDVNLMDRIN